VGSSTHCHRLGIHVINRKVGETRLSLGLLRLLGVSPGDRDRASRCRAAACLYNRLTENSTWDDRLLGEQLKELSILDLSFDLEATGFDMGEPG
jgi:hypothetical protein